MDVWLGATFYFEAEEMVTEVWKVLFLCCDTERGREANIVAWLHVVHTSDFKKYTQRKN